MRQAYDYWQNQPGNYRAPGLATGSARAPPERCLVTGWHLEPAAVCGRRCSPAAAPSARPWAPRWAIRFPPLRSPGHPPPHSRPGAVVWLGAPQEEGHQRAASTMAASTARAGPPKFVCSDHRPEAMNPQSPPQRARESLQVPATAAFPVGRVARNRRSRAGAPTMPRSVARASDAGARGSLTSSDRGPLTCSKVHAVGALKTRYGGLRAWSHLSMGGWPRRG